MRAWSNSSASSHSPSARLGTLWARPDVRKLEGGTTTVDHPVVSRLQLRRERLPIGELVLLLYYADEHSDSAEKLQVLASLAARSETLIRRPMRGLPPRLRPGVDERAPRECPRGQQ
ncbi:MmyB family transcriptional regulator [Saccharomonospora marina]|uniref:MmyB family transcriptional regulator n=1 Tax=Saccharomonospora marina TaxID=632569 RepID=UPI0038CDAB75